MSHPEPLPDSGPSAFAEVESLRQQVRQLEATVLALRQAVEETSSRESMFATAAFERLHVIEHGDSLLKELTAANEALQSQIVQLESQLRQQQTLLTAETRKSEMAVREVSRGMEELAARERALTRQILELRNEGLLHSIIRRMKQAFS